MKKIEQNKKQKRERILKAAQEIFQYSGFIGASMDKIAEKACVTKQTVYRYFSTKEVLFQAALEVQRLQAKIDDAEYGISVFLNTLLSMRMPVLTGLECFVLSFSTLADDIHYFF